MFSQQVFFEPLTVGESIHYRNSKTERALLGLFSAWAEQERERRRRLYYRNPVEPHALNWRGETDCALCEGMQAAAAANTLRQDAYPSGLRAQLIRLSFELRRKARAARKYARTHGIRRPERTPREVVYN